MLSLRALKEQLYIGIKLVKDKNITMISIKIYLSLTR